MLLTQWGSKSGTSKETKGGVLYLTRQNQQKEMRNKHVYAYLILMHITN